MTRVGNRYTQITDEVEALSLDELLAEATQWLGIMQADPRWGWTPDVLRDQASSLRECKNVVAQAAPRTGAIQQTRACLAGYCIKMRRVHDGFSASAILNAEQSKRS